MRCPPFSEKEHSPPNCGLCLRVSRKVRGGEEKFSVRQGCQSGWMGHSNVPFPVRAELLVVQEALFSFLKLSGSDRSPKKI